VRFGASGNLRQSASAASRFGVFSGTGRLLLRLVIVAGETNLLSLSMSIFAMRADDVQRAAIDRLHHATTAAEVTA